jgi:hypothetical protein
MTPHAGDALSALLDGQLAPADAAIVHAHVAACADCAAELDAVRHARAALRRLPAVDPPPEFLEALLVSVPASELPRHPARPARRDGRAWLPQAAAAVAAGLLLVVGSRGAEPASAVTPEVTGQVEQHAATLSAVSSGLGGPDPIVAPNEVTPTTTPRWSLDELPRPYRAPVELAGYRLAHAFRAPDGLHLLYEKGGYALSVFQQRGTLDPSRLPDHGEAMEVRGRPAWRWEGGTAAGRVVVVQLGSLVVTFVGDESEDVVRAAAEALPGPSGPSLATRLRQACGDALEALSPVG